MKTITKLFALAVVILGFSASSFGQGGVTDYAPTSATIITPITIVKATDMNFGNIGVNASLGTVVLVPAGTRSATGGVSLPVALAGTVTAASFTVSGNANNTYSITLPTTLTITRAAGTETMTVNTFTSTPTVALGGTLSAGGTQTLNVGATLNVAGGQVAGVYTNATGFAVSVNYN